MMATETPISLPTPRRRPLQPKNTISPNITLTTLTQTKPKKDTTTTTFSFYPTTAAHDQHKNYTIPTIIDLSLDASLAEELNAVKKRLERVRAEREKTEKVLQERDRKLDLMMNEILDRGEFQKELENEVDRLYRLNQLQLASMRRSPIRSLRERQMLKTNKQVQSENSQSAKSGESKENVTDQCSTTGSTSAPASSFESSSILSTGASTSNWSSSSRMSPIPLRLSLDSTASSNQKSN